MDPALWELFEEGNRQDEVAAIIRLEESGTLPDDIRLITQFGNVATCRLQRRSIVTVREDEAVASLKAPRLLSPEPTQNHFANVQEDKNESLSVTDERRPVAEVATGRGVVVGVIDWGFDFAHPDFCYENGKTRILAFWDQRSRQRTTSTKIAISPKQTPQPYGYGVVYLTEAIDQALATEYPYDALGYHPADVDPQKEGAHGTHVASIAAGNGRSGSPMGIAPEANLIFVHLADLSTQDRDNLGNSVALLEAIDFIVKFAGDRPCVINLSMGRHGEPHDGTTLVEQGLDALLNHTPGLAIVQSTGNYFDRDIHTQGQIRPGESKSFVWQVDEADSTPNELEVWYSGKDIFSIELCSSDRTLCQRVKLGDRSTLSIDGHLIGSIYHRARDPNNLDNHINIFLYTNAPTGAWEITLIAEDLVDGRFHAWIERDLSLPNCQSRFHPEDAVNICTTGTICNGFRTIAVGAYNSHSSKREIASFSSSGPTRDGRIKPDLVAPGVSILAARSAPRNPELASVQQTCRKSGTSMAAPHVTGTVALMFQVAGRQLKIEETRTLLLSATQKVTTEDAFRVGSGYLDTKKAVDSVRQNISKHTKDPQEFMANASINHFKNTEVFNNMLQQEYSFSEDAVHQLFLDMNSSLDTFDEEMFDPPDIVDSPTLPRLVELAETVLNTRDVSPSSATLLNIVLAESNLAKQLQESAIDIEQLSPTLLFDAFTTAHYSTLRQQLEQIFEVVATPRSLLPQQLQQDDILLRSALGEGATHLSLISDGEIYAYEELDTFGLQPECRSRGNYVQVVDAGVFPHQASDRFARRLSDEDDYLSHNHLILRLRSDSIGLVSESVARLRLPVGKGMWVGRLRGAGTPEEMRQRIQQNNISWLSILIVSSNGTRSNPSTILQEYLSFLRSQPNTSQVGIWLWGWASPDNPNEFVGEMVEAARQTGAQGIIIDAEVAWKWNGRRAEQLRRTQATTLMERLLPTAREAGLSVGVTSYGATWAHSNFPWAEFAQADFGLPQIYDAQNNLDVETYPRRSVEAWRSLGFRKIMPISNAFSKSRSQMQRLLQNTPVPDRAISWWVWRGADANSERWQAIREYQLPIPTSQPTNPTSASNSFPVGQAQENSQAETAPHEHYQIVVRSYTIDFHVYVSVPNSREKVSQLQRFFERLPDQHLAVLYPIFIMEKKPGGMLGGGTWRPNEVSGSFLRAGQVRNTGIPSADIERLVINSGKGLIGLSRDRWERPMGRLEFTVFHEVGHCVDYSLGGLVPSGATEADFAGMATNRCGAGNLMIRKAVEAYARLICSPTRIYHELPASETSSTANQRLTATLRRSPAFSSVPTTWQPLSVSTSREQLGLTESLQEDDELEVLGRAFEGVTFRSSADIDNYFSQRLGIDFITWFNRNIANRGAWRGKQIRESSTTQSLFNSIWNNIPILFGTESINLIQFLSLFSIMMNETGGSFQPKSEQLPSPLSNSEPEPRTERQRRRLEIKRNHPGLAYVFDSLIGVSGRRKRSYNTSPSNKTAFYLFNDADYIAAHGHLLPRELQNTRDEVWRGDTYPQDRYPTDPNNSSIGFIREADFYKFRGRGLIQTTFRAAYMRIIRFILEYSGSHPTIISYRDNWRTFVSDRISRDDLHKVASRSTNEDWDTLFQRTDLIIPCKAVYLHSSGRRPPYLDFSSGMGIRTYILGVGDGVGSTSYARDTFLPRVRAILQSLPR